MMRNVSAYVFVVAASLAGCAPTGDVEYAGEVHVTSPELVTISPGVQVVADADEPLFYSDGMYWLYRDNGWYRSDSYRGGFARIEYSVLPQRIRVIEQPQTYVQYRRHGENRYARERQMQTRSQQSPTYTQPQQVQQPTYTQPQSQSPATSVPSQPDTYRPGDAHPTARPEGINPTQPNASTQPPHATTTPPAVVTPNNPSAPAPGDQRFQQPIDRANPPAKAPIGNPGPGIRPDDRTDPHAPGRIAPPGNSGTGPTNPGPGHDKNGTPGNSANTPGQNKNVSAPGNSGNTPAQNAPGNSGNSGQTARPDDRNARPDHDMNGNGNIAAPGNSANAPGNSGNAPGQNRDDKAQNHGNPSAPSRIAPTAPTTSPASPNTSSGAAKDADKDKHEHASAPGNSEKNDQKKDKKKNEKY